MTYYCPSCKTEYECHDKNIYLCNYSKLICFECFIKYDIYNTKGNKIKFTIRDNSIFYTIDTCKYNYTYESNDNECVINDIHCYVLLRDNSNVLLLLPTLPISIIVKKDTKTDKKEKSIS
jgi:hypothetical protein